MKSDIDSLMQQRGLDALLVFAGHDHSPTLDYLTGGVRITGGAALKLLGHDPILIVNGMETAEARATGLTAYDYHSMGMETARKSADGDAALTQALFWGGVLSRLGLPGGKVGIYGAADANTVLALVDGLRAHFPQYTLVGEMGPTLFDAAYTTKDASEMARIRSVAQRTSSVVRATWDFIASHRADDSETVVKDDGSPLTIGDVKRFIRRELLDCDLEDTAMIFAQGEDGGHPHSRGNESQALKLGQAIVFDLFPREIGGGYHHDMTRTWCIGYAPPEVREAYDQVMQAFDIALEQFGVGKPTHLMQEAVQDYLESVGHATARSKPGTAEGYVHSLGHGVGLNVHESPRISHLSKEDRFAVGNVITIEPGVYYPSRGFGIRVEDLLIVDERGELVSLTDVPKALVLPLRG
ncbi:MAG: M24 family metallopeptidase [Anaerolineae bacterium]|jgi:Xaa-Pro aminopeptidase|nr:M24 family metallopeptidase [Anaerolineae bacterium]